MAEPFILCHCGLAKYVVDVDGPSGRLTAYTCEHCDTVCTDQRCHLCSSLSRSSRTA